MNEISTTLVAMGWSSNLEGKFTPPPKLFENMPSSGFSLKDAQTLQNLLGVKVRMGCWNPDLKGCDCPSCGGFND
jgi:hypothetical protein